MNETEQRREAAQKLVIAIMDIRDNFIPHLSLTQIASDFPGVIRCVDNNLIIDETWV
jgi:hypothetical protein